MSSPSPLFSNVVALRPATQRVDAYLDAWLAQKASLRRSTVVAYRIHVERFWKPSIGHLTLATLTTAHVEQAHRAILAGRYGHVSITTVHRIHATLMSALNSAVRRGLLRSNPAALVELPRPERPEMVTWTAAQAARFLTDATTHPWYLLYRVLLLTGLRRGEALGAQWRDLSEDHCTLLIRRQLTLVSGQQQLGPPKSVRGIRTVHLDPTTATLLAHAHARAADPSPDGFIFQTPTGESLHPAAVTRSFARLVASLDLPEIRLHDLRHTSASLALEAGEPLTHVSRRLGHSTLAITADIYTHVSSEAAQTAADLFAARLHRP